MLFGVRSNPDEDGSESRVNEWGDVNAGVLPRLNVGGVIGLGALAATEVDEETRYEYPAVLFEVGLR